MVSVGHGSWHGDWAHIFPSFTDLHTGSSDMESHPKLVQNPVFEVIIVMDRDGILDEMLEVLDLSGTNKREGISEQG